MTFIRNQGLMSSALSSFPSTLPARKRFLMPFSRRRGSHPAQGQLPGATLLQDSGCDSSRCTPRGSEGGQGRFGAVLFPSTVTRLVWEHAHFQFVSMWCFQLWLFTHLFVQLWMEPRSISPGFWPINFRLKKKKGKGEKKRVSTCL